MCGTCALWRFKLIFFLLPSCDESVPRCVLLNQIKELENETGTTATNNVLGFECVCGG